MCHLSHEGELRHVPRRITGAIDRFRQALAIQPDHAEAREYLERASQLRKP